jgi:hypothetical protein
MLKYYKDIGVKQTVYMYPTSLEYKSDISKASDLNATYQKDLPIIAIPIRPKVNSDAGSPDDVKAIIDGIDTAFSLIPNGYNVKIQAGIFKGVYNKEILDHLKESLDAIPNISPVKTEYKAIANDNANNSNNKNTTEQKNKSSGSKSKIELRWLNDNTNVIVDQNGNSSIKINNIDDLISVSDQYHELIVNRGKLTNPKRDYSEHKQMYIDLIKQINNAGLKAKPFVINFQKKLNKNSIGFFNSDTNRMILTTDARMDAYPLKVIAHEYAHAVTLSLLNGNRPLYDRITAIRTAAEKANVQQYKNNVYALTDNAEFVAEVLTNPRLQKSLSEVPSLGSKGLEIIRKVFASLLSIVSRFSKDEHEKINSLLDDALSTIYELHNPDFANENHVENAENVENESSDKPVGDKNATEDTTEHNIENESDVNGHAYVDHSVEDGAVSHADVKYASASKDFSDSMNDIMSDKESDKISKEVIADC